MTTNEPTTDQTGDPKLCTVHAHWTCSRCNWTRPNANRNYPQDCAKCGGRIGEFKPTRHQQAGVAQQHAEERAEYIALYGSNEPQIRLTPEQLDLLASLGPVIWAARRDHLMDYATGGLSALVAAMRAWVAEHPEEVPDAEA